MAGGTESMSFVPMGGNKISINPWLQQNYPDSYLSMGLTAERVAQHYGITREQADEFALASHQKALAAQAAGKFERGDRAGAGHLFGAGREIEDPQDGSRVQGGRRAARRYVDGGAGQTEGGLPRQGYGDRGQLVADVGRRGGGGGDVARSARGRWESQPLARFVAFAYAGCLPEEMGVGPVYAIPKALKLAGLTLDQIDLIELNEAFAAQSLAVIKTLGLAIGPGECQRRRDRAGASAGLHRRQADRQPAAGDEAAEGEVRDGDDVRGRRHGRRGNFRESELEGK